MRNKNKILIVFIIAVFVIAVVFFIKNTGEKPFAKLSADDISAVSLELHPSDKKIELNSDEINKFVEIIGEIVVYSTDDSYSEYAGQAVICKVIKKDGTCIEIVEYNPFLIIDNKGYRAKYEPCEKLNAFANELMCGRAK